MRAFSFRSSALAVSAAVLLAACSAAEAPASPANPAASAPAPTMTANTTPIIGAALPITADNTDISSIASGTYKMDPGHGYVAFSYVHGQYSRPILRWRVVDATVNLDSANPENSTLKFTIPVSSIDSGVDVWDEKLVKSDWFDAENHPNITFTSTSFDQTSPTTGTVTGDLTIKGNTRPVTLAVTLNGVGQHFMTNQDMFGVSASASFNRGDFGVDTYLPSAGDIVVQVEGEFLKSDE